MNDSTQLQHTEVRPGKVGAIKISEGHFRFRTRTKVSWIGATSAWISSAIILLRTAKPGTTTGGKISRNRGQHLQSHLAKLNHIFNRKE